MGKGGEHLLLKKEEGDDKTLGKSVQMMTKGTVEGSTTRGR